MLAASLASFAGCRSVWTELDLHGRTIGEVVAQRGSPDWTAELKLHRGVQLREFHYGLHRFAPSRPGVFVEVKELGWKRWFGSTSAWMMKDGSGEWRVVDTLSWRRDVQF